MTALDIWHTHRDRRGKVWYCFGTFAGDGCSLCDNTDGDAQESPKTTPKRGTVVDPVNPVVGLASSQKESSVSVHTPAPAAPQLSLFGDQP